MDGDTTVVQPLFTVHHHIIQYFLSVILCHHNHILYSTIRNHGDVTISFFNNKLGMALLFGWRSFAVTRMDIEAQEEQCIPIEKRQ
jgi:hypothetical protein